MIKIIHTRHNTMVYKRIVHISDIHIKLQKNHDEYREVFQKLYDKISNYNYDDTFIVITGDILHDRTSLSPEAIILCTEFLKELSSRLKTILIAGNHDGYLNSSERIDNISGVLYGKDIKDLYYLKDTGIYQYDNLIIGVSSVFDGNILSSKELDKYIEVNHLNQDQTTKIALYHGAVSTVKLQNLFEARGEKRLDEFDGYHYVLLGDIHLYQYLDDAKRVAYASSLISQNYGECDDYHGYLLWDIENGTSYYEKIENPYRYKCCNLQNDFLKIDDKEFNIVDQIDEIKSYLPSKGKVQIISNDKDKELVKFLKSKIKDVYWSDKTDILRTIKRNNEKIYDYKINRKELINEILRNKHNKEIKKDIIDWIEDELKTHDNKIVKDINNYQILNLRFSNLFIYGEENEIDMTRYNLGDIVLISGKNSAGKSSLIDIILFNLYNEYGRQVSSSIKKENSGILNNSKNSGYSEMKIKIDREIYVIRRDYKRNKKGLIETSSYLYRLVETDDKRVLLSKDSGVSKEIINMIGNKDNFMLMNMMMQHDNISFKNKNQTERKMILYKLLNLDKYDKIKSDMDEERRRVIREYDKLQSSLKNINIVELNVDYNNSIRDSKVLEEEILNNNHIVESLNVKYQDLMKNHTNVNMDKIKKEQKVMKNLDDLKREMEDINSKIETIDIDKLEEDYNRIEEELSNQLESKLKSQKSLFETKYTSLSLPIEYQKVQDELSKINTFQQSKSKEILSNEYLEICEEYKRVDCSAKIPFKMEIKSEEEYKTNDIDIKNIEDDIDLSINSKNSLVKSIEEDERNNIDEEFKRNEERSRINMEIVQKKRLKDELEEHEYDPNCEFCVKNPKVKELLRIKIELDQLIEKDLDLESKISKTIDILKGEYDKKLEDLKVCNKRIEECTSKLKLMRDRKDNYDMKDILNRKILKEKEIKEWDIMEKSQYQLLNKLKELDDQKEKIEHNMLVEEERKTSDKEIKEIRREIQLNKKKRDDDYNRYLKNKDLMNKKSMNILMLENLEKELKDIKYEKQIKLKNDKIESDISEIQDKLKKVNDTLNKQNIEQYKKKDFISRMEKDINDYKVNIEKISYIENIKDRYEYYKDILEKDGLSICIIKKYLSIISDGINEIIKGIINKRVDLYEDSDKIILDIYNDKDEIVNFVGGMESFMIDLSFKIVLSRLLEVSRSNFLIIDEGISSFDKEHLGNIEELFIFLKNYYDIIFIMSHIEGIKDYVDNQVIISSSSGYSRISSSNFR